MGTVGEQRRREWGVEEGVRCGESVRAERKKETEREKERSCIK